MSAHGLSNYSRSQAAPWGSMGPALEAIVLILVLEASQHLHITLLRSIYPRRASFRRASSKPSHLLSPAKEYRVVYRNDRPRRCTVCGLARMIMSGRSPIRILVCPMFDQCTIAMIRQGPRHSCLPSAVIFSESQHSHRNSFHPYQFLDRRCRSPPGTFQPKCSQLTPAASC